jgi:hypothetical protein
MAASPAFRIVDIVVTQSSDASFHCISVAVFYEGARSSAATRSPNGHADILRPAPHAPRSRRS